MKMKYVRFTVVSGSPDATLVRSTHFALVPDFGDQPSHIDLVNLVGQIAVSAGFVEVRNGELVCSGRSESLKLESHPDDSQALLEYLGLRDALS